MTKNEFMQTLKQSYKEEITKAFNNYSEFHDTAILNDLFINSGIYIEINKNFELYKDDSPYEWAYQIVDGLKEIVDVTKLTPDPKYKIQPTKKAQTDLQQILIATVENLTDVDFIKANIWQPKVQLRYVEYLNNLSQQTTNVLHAIIDTQRHFKKKNNNIATMRELQKDLKLQLSTITRTTMLIEILTTIKDSKTDESMLGYALTQNALHVLQYMELTITNQTEEIPRRFEFTH